MLVTRRAFVGVGAATGVSYMAARSFTRLAGAPLPPVPNQQGRTRVWQASMGASTSIWSPVKTGWTSRKAAPNYGPSMVRYRGPGWRLWPVTRSTFA